MVNSSTKKITVYHIEVCSNDGFYSALYFIAGFFDGYRNNSNVCCTRWKDSISNETLSIEIVTNCRRHTTIKRETQIWLSFSRSIEQLWVSTYNIVHLIRDQGSGFHRKFNFNCISDPYFQISHKSRIMEKKSESDRFKASNSIKNCYSGLGIYTRTIYRSKFYQVNHFFLFHKLKYTVFSANIRKDLLIIMCACIPSLIM